MNAAAGALGQLNSALSNLNSWVQTGKLPENTYWGKVAKSWNEPVDQTSEKARISSMKQSLDEVEAKQKWGGVGSDAMSRIRMKAFELRSGIHAAENFASCPSLFSEEEIKNWKEREDDLRRVPTGKVGIPLPVSDPRKAGDKGFPGFGSDDSVKSVQISGEAEVRGEASLKVEAGSELIRVVEEAKRVISLAGKFMSNSWGGNGPGSNGRSSPDAMAPGTGGTGFGGGGL
jgi:hypothetical protein